MSFVTRGIITIFCAFVASTLANADADTPLVHTALEFGKEVFGHANLSNYVYYTLNHASERPFWIILQPCDGNPDLIVSKQDKTPTIHKYEYMSINGHRKTDKVQIVHSEGVLHIGIYGMTASNFTIKATYDGAAPKMIPGNKGLLRMATITSNKAVITWKPSRFIGKVMNSTEVAYKVYYTTDTEDSLTFGYNPRKKTLVDMPCGMKYSGVLAPGASKISKQGGQITYQHTINRLKPNTVYSVNVLAIQSDTEFAAYEVKSFKTIDFTPLSVGRWYRNSLKPGMYKHYRLEIGKLYTSDSKDNYHVQAHLKLRITLHSTLGDADVLVSRDVGPPTIYSSDYSSEAVTIDVIDIDYPQEHTAYYISVYSKDSSQYVLTTSISDVHASISQTRQTTKKKTEEKELPEWLSTLLHVLFEILKALSD
mmetsp:Transcript_25211/g.28038  ORF Transcript_25211/g.28038 Transcript_25211/m.28038 type:complete len:424 (+) Transcript_25211:54-1325(+)